MEQQFKHGDLVKNKYASMHAYFIGVSVTEPAFGVVEFKNSGTVECWKLEAIVHVTENT